MKSIYVILKHDEIHLAFNSLEKAEKHLKAICEYNCEYGGHYTIITVKVH